LTHHLALIVLGFAIHFDSTLKNIYHLEHVGESESGNYVRRSITFQKSPSHQAQRAP